MCKVSAIGLAPFGSLVLSLMWQVFRDCLEASSILNASELIAGQLLPVELISPKLFGSVKIVVSQLD